MGRAIVGVAAGVLILVGGAGGALAWTVRSAASRVAAQPAKLAAMFPNVQIKEQTVEHGLFSATHRVTVELGCMPDAPGQPRAAKPEPITVTWEDAITRGNFGDGTLAIITSRPVLSPTAQSQLAAVFGKETPLTILTRAKTSGELESELRVAAAHGELAGGLGIESGPIRATVHTRFFPGGEDVQSLVIDHPPWELRTYKSEGDARFHVGEGHVETRFEPRAKGAATSWVLPATSAYTLKSAGFDVSAAKPNGLPMGTLHGELGAVKGTSKVTLTDGLYSVHSELHTSGKVQGVTLDEISLSSALNRFAAEPYAHLVSSALGRSFSCDPAVRSAPPEAQVAELGADLAKLLPRDPEFVVGPLAVVIGGQHASLAYSLGTRGISEAEANPLNPVVLMLKGVATLDVKVDRGLLVQAGTAMSALGAGQLPAGAPSGPDAVAAFLDGMIAMGVEAGYVTRSGDVIAASAAYQGGQLSLNGRPFQLPDLGALGASLAHP